MPLAGSSRRRLVPAIAILALISACAGTLYAVLRANAAQPVQPTATAPAVPTPEAAAPRPASLFVAPDGARGLCSRAAPCANFRQAYRVADPGEVVEVGAGSYGTQLLVAVAGRSGPDVEFRPAPGARVVLGGLSFGTREGQNGPSHITVQGMATSYRRTEPGRGNQRGIWVGPAPSTSRSWTWTPAASTAGSLST